MVQTMGEIVRLRFAVDTLEAHVAGELPLTVRGALEHGKEQAIATDTPYPYILAGREFFIQAKGLQYHPYLLSNELMAFRVTHSNRMPMLSMRLSAFGLATLGHEELYRIALACAAELGAIHENKLSRIDVACDFQGFEPTEAEMKAVRCRMRYRAYHQNGDGRTFQFGKGPFVVRLYNKTAQAAEKKLGWVEEVHRACEGYRSDMPVYRAEVQLRRDFLKERGIDTVREAFSMLPALFITGMTEVELRVPKRDATITRWPVDPRWEAIRAVDGVSAPLARIRKTPAMLSQHDAVKRALSAAATFGAYTDKKDLLSLIPILVGAMLDVLEEEDRDFSELMEDKRRRLGNSYFWED